MKERSCGFTLIELLIVVAIIGILAAIAIPNFLQAQVRAKIARVEADSRAITTALEVYRIDYNVYVPDPDERWGTAIPAGYTWNSDMLWPLTTPDPYISSLPADPFDWNTDTGWMGHNNQWVYGYTMEYQIKGPGQVIFVIDKNAFWVMWSAGPDQLWDGWRAGVNNRKFIYDPTNGTVSFGDIVWTNSTGIIWGGNSAANPQF